MKVSIVAAMTEDRVIGKAGELPWKVTGNLPLFKSLTLGNTVVMGKGTWLSLPAKNRPLPERTNIVISSTLQNADGARVCRTVQEAMELARLMPGDLYCIGGAKLFAAMLPIADTMHISWIKQRYAGDTHFPEIKFAEWREIQTREFEEFTYKQYLRVA